MIICIDFDGTMADHQYPLIGEAVPYAVEWCKIFMGYGHDIILWTMRSGDELDQAAGWMIEHDIELYGINQNPTQHSWTNSPKAYGHMYIDDAAIGCPLINIEGFGRPCVDWFRLGPMVMARLGEV